MEEFDQAVAKETDRIVEEVKANVCRPPNKGGLRKAARERHEQWRQNEVERLNLEKHQRDIVVQKEGVDSDSDECPSLVSSSSEGEENVPVNNASSSESEGESEAVNDKARFTPSALPPGKIGKLYGAGGSTDTAGKLSSLFTYDMGRLEHLRVSIDVAMKAIRMSLVEAKAEERDKLMLRCEHIVTALAGEDESWVTALLLYFASRAPGIDDVWDWTFNSQRSLVQLTRKHFCAYFKGLTTIIHKFGITPTHLMEKRGFDPMNVEELHSYYAWQYLHTLVGRGEFEDERVQEVQDRSTAAAPKRSFDPDTLKWEPLQYLKDFDRCHQICRDNAVLVTREADVLTFDDFWNELWTAGTQGFASQAKIFIDLRKKLRGKTLVSKRYQIRLTKKGFFSTLSKDEVLRKLTEEGICTSTGSLKFEEAAVRSLFASDAIHFLISAWITAKLEERIYEGNKMFTDLGLKALAELKHMLRLSSAMMQLHYGFCYDFRNFNIQHSRSDMRSYYNMIKEIAGEACRPELSWIRGIEWLCEATMNTWIRSEGSAQWHAALRGLLSGIRATQGINTTLNVSYILIICMCVDRLLPDSETLDQKSHGDDVIAIVDSWLRGVVMYYTAEEIGLEAQPLKVTLEQGRSQYLRLVYESTGHIIGYLARAVSRFVSTEWKPKYGSKLSDRIGELNSQVSLLKRRGMCTELAQAIKKCMVQYYAGEGSSLPGKVYIPQALESAPVESQGAGLIRDDGVSDPVYIIRHNLPRQPIVDPPPQVMRAIDGMPRKAVVRYWHTLARQYPKLAGLHTLKTKSRAIMQTHVGDCMLQLPRFLQHVDRETRNRSFALWARKWGKLMATKPSPKDLTLSLDTYMLEAARAAAREDVFMLDALATGHTVPLAKTSHYERLRLILPSCGIKLELFATSALSRADKETRAALILDLVDHDTGGYPAHDVYKIVVEGHQFNQVARDVLPQQFASLIRARGLYRFEEHSRDLALLRGWMYAFEVFSHRYMHAHPRLTKLLHY
jgi:hypothetical protein